MRMCKKLLRSTCLPMNGTVPLPISTLDFTKLLYLFLLQFLQCWQVTGLCGFDLVFEFQIIDNVALKRFNLL